MNVPKIIDVKPQKDMVLDVVFADGQVKRLDIKPYTQTFSIFKQLENPALFDRAKVDVGGMGIVWNDQIDLSRYDAWEFGVSV